ncbi:hypothetical protein J6590_089491 [Homalodisca vitripennis]|nr:hypothetical protein J6590_089491 [Homalodisca vitripennis]
MGALGMLCGNEETRDWLRGLDLGLGISDPGGIGVICGDYREVIRSIKVFHRVDGPMAEKDSATILIAIGKQNAGISVSDWKVVGVIHTGASRTMESRHSYADGGWDRTNPADCIILPPSVTMTTEGEANRICSWRVSDEPSLSDHAHIYFNWCLNKFSIGIGETQSGYHKRKTSGHN